MRRGGAGASCRENCSLSLVMPGLHTHRCLEGRGEAMKRKLLGLALLLAAVVALASCGTQLGGKPRSATTSPSTTHGAFTGVYGIAVIGQHGPPGAATPPSTPLPGGFGQSSNLKPIANATIVVKPITGVAAGRAPWHVTANAEGIFKVALPPGKYVLFGKDYEYLEKVVTVRTGALARIMLYVGISWG